jgi:primosomal protein N''
MAQLVEHLPNKYKSLGSKSKYTKKEKSNLSRFHAHLSHVVGNNFSLFCEFSYLYIFQRLQLGFFPSWVLRL